MAESTDPDTQDSAKRFVRKVGEKESRKLKAQRKGTQSIWFGFGMFGIIGWSVTVPTLLGAGLGIWLDQHYPMSARSWTLMLLVAGLVLGCMNAWHWVTKEEATLRAEQERDDE